MNKKIIRNAVSTALLCLPLITMAGQQNSQGCSVEELAAHDALSEVEKQKFYGLKRI